MNGQYRVQVTTKKLQYDFAIHRKFTLIQGDSATGKTVLYGLLMIARREPWVQASCPVECLPAASLGENWAYELQRRRDTIIFFDDTDDFVNSDAFAEAAMRSDNYFVLMSREPLQWIPESEKEICEMKPSGSMHFLVPSNKEGLRFNPQNELARETESSEP